ncbi:hypothetical protein [Nonomuraea typhae]|uniref:hypothetical protein n=1 Tax=Nonomuraea typhae TaxID=2603600 RepID=UPI0012FBBD74|nr:hypothetical protein [Nonomuraea typhae]
MIGAWDVIKRALGSRGWQWAAVLTFLAGALVAAVVPASEVVLLTQSVISVGVPFLTIRLAGQVRTAVGARVPAVLLGAAVVSAVAGVLGVVLCVVALAVRADPAQAAAPAVVLGSVLVQVGAGLLGTGLGMLLRPAWVACAASVVVPLGVYGLLGGIEALRPVQGWVTLYAAARNQLSGQMGGLEWGQWAVVTLIWVVGLNLLAAARLRAAGVLVTGPEASRPGPRTGTE